MSLKSMNTFKEFFPDRKKFINFINLNRADFNFSESFLGNLYGSFDMQYRFSQIYSPQYFREDFETILSDNIRILDLLSKMWDIKNAADPLQMVKTISSNITLMAGNDSAFQPDLQSMNELMNAFDLDMKTSANITKSEATRQSQMDLFNKINNLNSTAGISKFAKKFNNLFSKVNLNKACFEKYYEGDNLEDIILNRDLGFLLDFTEETIKKKAMDLNTSLTSDMFKVENATKTSALLVSLEPYKGEVDVVYTIFTKEMLEEIIKQVEESLKPTLDTKQDKLTAGDNITIENNVISAKGLTPEQEEKINKAATVEYVEDNYIQKIDFKIIEKT